MHTHTHNVRREREREKRESRPLLEDRAKKTGRAVGPQLGVIGDGFRTTARADTSLRWVAASAGSVVAVVILMGGKSQGLTLMDLRLVQCQRE